MFDAALVKLKHPLKFDSKVKPIKLATSLPNPNARGQISGWGRLCSDTNCCDDDENCPKSRILQDLDVQISTGDVCRNSLHAKLRNSFHEAWICAFKRGSSSCKVGFYSNIRILKVIY